MFLEVLDLVVQRKDFLVLEPLYRELGFVREYVNTGKRLKHLGGVNFYEIYYNYLRSFTTSETCDNVFNCLISLLTILNRYKCFLGPQKGELMSKTFSLLVNLST